MPIESGNVRDRYTIKFLTKESVHHRYTSKKDIFKIHQEVPDGKFIVTRSI